MERIGTMAFRIARAVISISFLLFTATVGCPLFQMPGLLIFYPWSRSLWRSFNSLFIEWWQALMLIFIELVLNIKFVVTGDELPPGERALIICNHPSETDWLLFIPLAYRKGMLGNMKVVLKKELRFVPVMGQALDTLDWLFLDRDWETDRKLLTHRCRSWTDDKYRLWLFLFPEGTDFAEEKRLKSVKFAQNNGLDYYQNLLVPRTTGFTACISELRQNLDAVYDITLGYPNTQKPPNPITCILGISPRVVHGHIRRFPIKDLPQKEEELKQWLYSRYKEKDGFLDHFKQKQIFPDGPGGRHELKRPQALYYWLIWWMFMGVLWIYWISNSSVFMWLVISGNIVQLIRTFYAPFRRWCGLNPPLDFDADSKKTN